MRFSTPSLLALAASLVSAASWSFQDGSLTIQSKGSGGAAPQKEKFSATSPLNTALSFSATDSLKLSLTTTEDKKPARAHQIFLTLTDPLTNLEDSYPFDVKESGKAKLDLTFKDLPVALTAAPSLSASITVGSFGSSTPSKSHAFTLTLASRTSSATGASGTRAASADASERYTPLPEIHHVFRADPKSPNILITGVFSIAVVLVLPLLLGAWEGQGLNFDHAAEAFGRAPVAYTSFLGAVVGLEAAFAMYYIRWKLFTLLPVVAVLGAVGFVGGAKALREVQGRRLAGKR